MLGVIYNFVNVRFHLALGDLAVCLQEVARLRRKVA
jgi:hypothetical protein